MTNEIPEGMLPFDLTKALEGWPVVTRDGREVKITCFKDFWVKCEKWIDTNEPHDLFLKKKTRTYWIAICPRSRGVTNVLWDDLDVLKETYKGGDFIYHKIELDEPEEYILPKSRADIEEKKTKMLWVAINKNGDTEGDHATSWANADRNKINDSGNCWFCPVEVEI